MFERTPLGVIARGLMAGAVGTAVMTLAQELASKLQSSQIDAHTSEGEDEPNDPWETAAVPALVAKRLGEGLFGKTPPATLIPQLTHVMHWAYGTSWGAVYAVVAESRRRASFRSGPPFGLGIWGLSYLQLVPMGLYQPPWAYSPTELSLDVGYHVAYGTGTATAHALLTR